MTMKSQKLKLIVPVMAMLGLYAACTKAPQTPPNPQAYEKPMETIVRSDEPRLGLELNLVDENMDGQVDYVTEGSLNAQIYYAKEYNIHKSSQTGLGSKEMSPELRQAFSNVAKAVAEMRYRIAEFEFQNKGKGKK